MTLIDSREGDIRYVSINRPEAGNRLDGETVAALATIYEEADPLKDGPAVIVLTGEGDIFSLGRQRPSKASSDPLDIVAEFSAIQRLNDAIQRCRAVTISGIHGRCEGAGLSLAARADITVITDDAVISFPEIPHGIPPTIVLSHYRYVLPRNILGDLIFTGRELTGSEAIAAGLAARSVPAASLRQELTAIARQVAAYDARSIALVKSFLSQTEDLPASAAPGLGISVYANEMAHRLMKR